MLRVRFFNTYEPVTSIYRDLLPYLAERGIASEVFISSAEYRQGGRGKLTDAVSNQNIRVHYLTSVKIRPKGLVQKALIMLSYVLNSMWKSIIGSSVAVNIFLTQPPLFNLWGLVLKKILRQSYICLVMDIYPDVAVKDGMFSPDGLFDQLLTKLSRFALQQADAVIVIGRCMAENMKAMGIAAEKINLITNWSNSEVVYPIPPSENRLRQRLRLDGKFVLLYSGNMGVSHYFDDLLKVIRRLHNLDRLHFVFIGEGMRRNEIENFIVTHQLQNVSLLPFQSLDRLAECLSVGDIHFVSLRKGFEGLVVPSKVYGALAAGRPVVYQGDSRGEIARMILDEGLGAVINECSARKLEQIIRMYLQSPDIAARQGLAALRFARSKISANNMTERYYQVISKICNE